MALTPRFGTSCCRSAHPAASYAKYLNLNQFIARPMGPPRRRWTDIDSATSIDFDLREKVRQIEEHSIHRSPCDSTGPSSTRRTRTRPRQTHSLSFPQPPQRAATPRPPRLPFYGYGQLIACKIEIATPTCRGCKSAFQR